MGFVELEVRQGSHDDYFYPDKLYLCLPTALPESGPIVATLKSVPLPEAGCDEKNLPAPRQKTMRAREEKFTVSQRRELQALLSELSQGSLCQDDKKQQALRRLPRYPLIWNPLPQ